MGCIPTSFILSFRIDHTCSIGHKILFAIRVHVGEQSQTWLHLSRMCVPTSASVEKADQVCSQHFDAYSGGWGWQVWWIMTDMSFTKPLSALFSMNYAVPVKISFHPEICSVTLYLVAAPWSGERAKKNPTVKEQRTFLFIFACPVSSSFSRHYLSSIPMKECHNFLSICPPLPLTFFLTIS